jgi:tRNA threonylcarbamoyladenosine biosynthesis protein TsaE
METIRIDSLADLPRAARAIIAHLGERPVVAFHGAMGAGKTTLIAEIARLLGVADSVSSPTFAIVNQYITATGEPLYHFDFYRIDRLEEAFDLGYEEYFYGGGPCLVEWPEKIEPLLPPDTLHVEIATHPDDRNARTITIGP